MKVDIGSINKGGLLILAMEDCSLNSVPWSETEIVCTVKTVQVLRMDHLNNSLVYSWNEVTIYTNYALSC